MDEKIEAEKSKSQHQKQKPHKTELDRLNEDIRDMFISKEVVTATGRRISAINAEKKQIEAKQKELSAANPKRKIGPKSKTHNLKKIKKINRFQKLSQTDNKFLKTLKIKQPKISIRKASLKEWKKKAGTKTSPKKIVTQTTSMESELEDDVPMPVLEPYVSLEDLRTLETQREFTDKPCPKSKKRFYKESDEENYNETDTEPELPKLSQNTLGISSKEKNDDCQVEQKIDEPKKTMLPKPPKTKRKKRGRPPVIPSLTPLKTVKNIDANMHSQSIFCQKCVLCDNNSGKPNHYISVHPDSEVYVSRLPPDTLIALKQNQMSRTAQIFKKNKSISFQHQCPFCDSIQSVTKKMWWNHIGIHTGEYGYQCSICMKKFSVVPAMRSHIKLHCKKAESITLRNLDSENKKNITVHLCDLCHFVQMDKTNIVKHLKTQHDIHDENLIERNMSQLILLEFQDSGSVNSKDVTSQRGRKKKSMQNNPQPSTSTDGTTEKLIEKNIEVFLPKENVDLNLDPNFMKYMNEISFKASSDVPQKPSIIDQLSMKFNSNQNNELDDIFQHSIFNDMSLVDQLSEKLAEDNNDQHHQSKVTNLNETAADEIVDQADHSAKILVTNSERENDEDNYIEYIENADNDQHSLESWEKRFSQQISDGGLSLADKFNRSMSNKSTNQGISSHFFDQISQRISQSSPEKSVPTSEFGVNANKTETVEKIASAVLSRHMSIAERLSERLRNEGTDVSSKLTINPDNNSKDAEREKTPENIPPMEKDASPRESGESPLKQQSSANDQPSAATEELSNPSDSFEGRLVIDEKTECNAVVETNEKLNNTPANENPKENETKGSGEKEPDDKGENEDDDDDDDDGDGEEDDDDDNWEDIEEIITAENSVPAKSKNKTMFETLSRLYTSIIPSKSTKSGTVSKKDQKLSDTKKSTKPSTGSMMESSKHPVQSKPGIFVIDKPRIEKESSNGKNTSESVVPSTSTFQPYMSMEIDPTLPDILLSDENDVESDATPLVNKTSELRNSTVETFKSHDDQEHNEISVKDSENSQSESNQEIMDIQTNEKSDKSPNSIQKIYNIGFNKTSDNNVRYRCLIRDCSFLYSDSHDGIDNHFKSEHPKVKWNGLCFSCNTVISDDDADMALSQEINHMLEVHLKKSSLPSLISSSSADENSNSSKNSECRPLLKIRRLSGDKLSTSKDEQQSIDQQIKPLIHNQLCKASESSGVVHFTLKQKLPLEFTMTTPIKQTESVKQSELIKATDKNSGSSVPLKTTGEISETVISKTTENTKESELESFVIESSSNSCETPFLKISEVVSLGSGEGKHITDLCKDIHRPSTSKELQEISENLVVSLKPWLKKSLSSKSKSVINDLLGEKSLYCLYKCMGENCNFRSQSAGKMKLHLTIHTSANQNKDKSYLECPYCETVCDDLNVYLIHMKIHSRDVYQCGYCFYRSAAYSNVNTHIINYHKAGQKQILLCIGKPQQFAEEAKFLAAERAKNVKAIPCNDCAQTFFNIREFINHITQHDPDRTHYFCSLCKTTTEISEMEKHLLKIHSISMFECIYCSFASPACDQIRNHLSQEHPSRLLFACIRRKPKSLASLPPNLEGLKKHTVLVNLSDTVSEPLIRPCRYTEAQLDEIEPKLMVKQKQTNQILTYVKKAKQSKPKINDNNQQQQQVPSSPPPMNIEIASVQSLAPGAKEIIFDSNNSSIISNAINQTANNSSSARTTEIVGTVTETLSTMTETSANEHADKVESSNHNQSISESNNGSSNVSEMEITGRTLMERIEKAAREVVKGTGLEGEELYKCAFPGCSLSASDAVKFSDHIFQHSSANTDFRCYHCKLGFKAVTELKAHFRVHAIHRYFCYFCSYTSAVPYDLLKHMNKSHSKSNFLTYPLISGRHDKTKDFFVVCPKNIQPIEIVQYGERMIRTVERKKALEKRHFTPEEMDQLPRQPIFFKELYCAICNYKTKVRINIWRHLDDHKREVSVPNVDPVNPVPCLNTSEKHFDKMVNLALSSNIYKENSKGQTIAVTDVKLPEFVSESKRYVCGVPECTYLTINENMLKCHLNALHIAEKTYTCPHCSYEVCKRGILVDKIIQHLKYHDNKLFTCNKCQYMHYQKNVVERHMSDKHPMEDIACVCYERTANNVIKWLRGYSSPASETAKSAQDLKPSNATSMKWECSICKGRTVTYNQMVSHANKKHAIKNRFMCAHCNFGSSTLNVIMDHIGFKHPTKVKEARFMFYKISDKVEMKQQQDTTPLWKRDPNKVKNIRGILMEEEDDGTQNREDLNYVAIPHDDFENDMETVKKVKTKLTRTKSATVVSSKASVVPIKASVVSSKAAMKPSTTPTPSPSPSCVTATIPSLTPTATTTTTAPTLPPSSLSSTSLSDALRTDPIFKIFTEPFHNCDRCSYLGKTEADLQSHMKTFDHLSLFFKMDKSLIFCCFKCSYSVKNIENLFEHWKNKHWSVKIVSGDSILTPDNPFWFRVSSQVGCARCNYQGSFSEVSKHHEIQHSEMTLALIDIKNRNECSQCSFEYNNLNALSQHFIRCHQFLRSPAKHISNEFLKEIAKFGLVQRYIRCLHCCSIFVDSFNYIHHHSQLHKKSKRDYEVIENTVLYRCPSCTYTTLSESEQYSHLIKHNDVLLTCKECKKICSTFNAFANHYKKLHPNAKYETSKIMYNNCNTKLYSKMKIILSNGFVMDKKQAELTEYGNMEIMKQLTDILQKESDSETESSTVIDQNLEIPTKNTPVSNRSALSKNVLSTTIDVNQLASTSFKNAGFIDITTFLEKSTATRRNSIQLSVTYCNSDDESKTKPQSNQVKKLVKRRQSVAAVCYANRFKNDDDDGDDDRNDGDWKPSNANKRKSLNLENKRRRLDTESQPSTACAENSIKNDLLRNILNTNKIDGTNVHKSKISSLDEKIPENEPIDVDSYVETSKRRKLSHGDGSNSCDKVIRIDDD